MPRVKWEDTYDGRILIFFPLTGTVIGALMGAWIFACGMLAIPVTAAALVMIAIPILITGGIHLDGFIDTCDARHSYKEREEKLRILSDPHVGAFGVIRLALYLLLLIAAMIVILQYGDTSMIMMPILMMTFSRTLSGWTSVAWPGAKKDGMLRSVAGDPTADEEDADDRPSGGNGTGSKQDTAGRQSIVRGVLLAEAVLTGVGMMLTDPVIGLVIVVSGIVTTVYYRYMSAKEFGGVTGDLAGWFLCVTELFSALCVAAYFLIGGLL